MGKSSDAPPEPDYKAAAEAKAAGDLEAARAAAAANRVNQVTPYGNLTYSNSGRKFDQTAYDAAMSAYRDNLAAYGSGPQQPTGPIPQAFGDSDMGGSNASMAYQPQMQMNAPVAPKIEDFYTGSVDDGWTATQTLAPAQQQLLDQQNKTSLGLAGLADEGLGYVRNALHNNITMASLPKSMVNPGQTGQDALMARFQPMMDQSREALRTQLANQGIMQGSEADSNAWRTQNQSENDLRMQAALNGINVGQNAQNQQFGLLSALQNQPLNMLNAVRTGSQVTNPSFANVPQQATTSGADYLGAAQGQNQYNLGLYNSQTASNNSSKQAIASIAAAAAMAMSDVRLKSNIKRIGTHSRGFGIYEYDIFGRHEIGVLAQEVEKVLPEAVGTHPSGFKMVNYGML